MGSGLLLLDQRKHTCRAEFDVDGALGTVKGVRQQGAGGNDAGIRIDHHHQVIAQVLRILTDERVDLQLHPDDLLIVFPR